MEADEGRCSDVSAGVGNESAEGLDGLHLYFPPKEYFEETEKRVVYHKNKENIENVKSGIQGFIKSIKKDITPIKAAISFNESSGFVEGNNNKFKLIKRILYGRANLVNLFRKSYLCFSMKKDNFSLKGTYSL